ncbi:universal stress protein [Sphingomonas sp. dw_22]|uniref:universal stress protein n=1 Tax=Sphingomonas sp. dw_22 TaxID=2721175 RepID=UPI001BD3E05C|nr:universal stress protein [Sphingomonas sp. dw_22]
MIQDLLIAIDNSAGSEPFLDTAIAFAERLDAFAKVTMISAGPLAAAEFAPFGAIYVPEDVLRSDEAARLEEVRARLASAKVPVELRGISDDVAWVAGDLRRSHPLADLLVVGPADSWEVPWLHRRVVETLLLSTGTPLLLLPTQSTLAGVGHAVLGWKPSREAIRTVHDLVAIADPGAVIDVVVVDEKAEGAADQPGVADLIQHLARHGFNATAHVIATGDSAAEALEEFTLRHKADLLAVGGYAHSRVREVVLGGVTRDLLGSARVPVLLSH